MYNLPDKSFRNSYNNRPQRQYEARRWDHNGYDELEYEQGSRYKNEEKNDRYKKNRKYQNDTTMASDLLEKQSQNERQGYNKDKWTHDKCEEVQGKGQSEQINREDTDKNKTHKPARRERRPDKQLYSVRDKRKNEEMRERTQKEPEVEKMEVQDREKIAIVKEEGLKLPKSIGKGASLMEDDTKSTISNVSTAISDPLKGYEEETSILKESKSDLSQKKIEEKPEEAKMEPGESEALIEILLDTSKRELLRISESEEDYEGFLDNICERHGLGKRMSLYFKINILKVLQELHSEPQKVDPVLDRLLGINFKLIMVDSGLESVDEVTLPYMEDEESLFLETPPAENDEEEA